MKQVCYVDAVAVAASASAVVTAALLASLCNFTVRQNIIFLRQVKRQLYVTTAEEARKERDRERKLVVFLHVSFFIL